MTTTTPTLDGLERERRSAMSRYYELTDRAARATRRGRAVDAGRYQDAADRALVAADRATEGIAAITTEAVRATGPDAWTPCEGCGRSQGGARCQVGIDEPAPPTSAAYAMALGTPQTGRTACRGEFAADVAMSLYRDVKALRRGEVPTTGRDTSADVRRAVAWRVVELVRHSTPPDQPWCDSGRTLRALRRKQQAARFALPSPRTMADTMTADGRIGRFCSAKALGRWMGPTTDVIDFDEAAFRDLCALPVAYPV